MKPPCDRNCADRTWDCKLTCPKWAAYEAWKQEEYARRQEELQGKDYVSIRATQIVRRRVTDYKQGRNYR